MNYSGSGNLTLSGNSSNNINESFSGSGNLIFRGNANKNIVLSYSGSGNLLFSGNATTGVIQTVFSYSGNGNILFTGNSTNNLIIGYSGNGLFQFSGTATTSTGGTYVYAIHLYNGIQLACEYPATSSDIRFKSGGKIIGVPVINSSNNHAGSIRIKVNGNVKALKIL